MISLYVVSSEVGSWRIVPRWVPHKRRRLRELGRPQVPSRKKPFSVSHGAFSLNRTVLLSTFVKHIVSRLFGSKPEIGIKELALEPVR